MKNAPGLEELDGREPRDAKAAVICRDGALILAVVCAEPWTGKTGRFVLGGDGGWGGGRKSVSPLLSLQAGIASQQQQQQPAAGGGPGDAEVWNGGGSDGVPQVAPLRPPGTTLAENAPRNSLKLSGRRSSPTLCGHP